MNPETDKKPFLVTTPIYYVNGLPHIGHAYTTVAADVLARAARRDGQLVFFSTGTDEHGAKIAEKAQELDQDTQAFVDDMAQAFESLWRKLNISHDRFIRTTEPAHKAAVQRVLADLYDREIIYKGEYEGLYCTGCEQFKNETDLIDGKCPDHNIEPVFTKEESYLMKMTVMQEELKATIKSDELLVTPAQYKTEILSFLEGKLEDVSISRKNVLWGVPLPFDKAHTTYVWVDAFLNYLTALKWNGDKADVPMAWPADIQCIGKDILRVHATIWPIMLMHLGIATQASLLVNGFILSGGRKMSKTLGNVISVDEMLERFGADGTRYLLLSAGPYGSDVDLTMERMTETYNADLANGLGNLVSRVLKLSENLPALPNILKPSDQSWIAPEYFQVSDVLLSVLSEVRAANRYMDDTKPWKLVKENTEEFRVVMENLFGRLDKIAFELIPFMPETATKIQTALTTGTVEPLFQRIA
jgi:methionyl-tRNA synthetase